MPLTQVNLLVQEERQGAETYKYLRVFIHNIPRKRIPGKYYLELKKPNCFTMGVGRDKQVLMEKMNRNKEALCEYSYGYKLVLDDLECS